jgi:hypothetical protein
VKEKKMMVGKKKQREQKRRKRRNRRKKRGGFFLNLRERWASEKKRKPTSMFGLVQVKWFGFISKQPN